MTTVVSVRGKPPEALLADPSFVYVGRANPWRRWKASIWGNPFSLREGRITVPRRIERSAWWAAGGGVRPGDTIASLYRRYLLATPELLARLPELRGRRLGCWCCDWTPGQADPGCHAVVLAQLADSSTAGPVVP